MSQLRITLIGGPTALIELDGFRLLTGPTFDPPGITSSPCQVDQDRRPRARRRGDRSDRRGAAQP